MKIKIGEVKNRHFNEATLIIYDINGEVHCQHMGEKGGQLIYLELTL